LQVSTNTMSAYDTANINDLLPTSSNTNYDDENAKHISSYGSKTMHSSHFLQQQIKRKLKIPNVTSEDLQSITIDNAPNETLHSLSLRHTVLVIFLRPFACAFCKQKIALAGDLFEDFMKLNTVPVFVHLEDKDTAENFMCSVRCVLVFIAMQEFYLLEKLTLFFHMLKNTNRL